jgi:F-type H+-transporting ATPase subunit b
MIHQLPTYFASADLLGALGINVTLLLLQAGAFLVLVLILGKFAYPVILRSIEERRAKIETGLENAKKAEAELKNVEQKVKGIIRDARTEADDIIARSQQAAAALTEAAEKRAAKKAEAIVANAHTDMAHEVAAARTALKQETAQLVASATAKIIKQKLDAKADEQLIHAELEA